MSSKANLGTQDKTAITVMDTDSSTDKQHSIIFERTVNNDPKMILLKKDANGETRDQHAKRCCGCLIHLTQLKAEVVMFLYMFAYVMQSMSITTMIMDKVCLVHLNQPTDICQHLNNHNATKSAVEKMANNYHLAYSLITAIPSAILVTFIGAWSDKYGRKSPMIAAKVGIIISGLGAILSSTFYYSRVEYLLVSAIFVGGTGGFMTILTILYCYASDITTLGKRTMKYATMEFAMGIAMPLGQLAGGYIFRFFGYSTVFMVSTSVNTLGLIWILLVLEETKGLDNTEGWQKKFKKLWALEPVKESIRAATKTRPNKGRKQILLLILAISIIVTSYVSIGGVSYYYAHHLFTWDNTEFSLYVSIFSVVGMISLLLSVPVFKRMGCEDPALGIVGSCSLLIKNVAIGLSNSVPMYLAASAAGILSGLSTLAGRSRLSKISSKDDLGKVFACLTAAESLMPMVFNAVTSQVFNASLDFFPGLIYVGMGAFIVIPLAIYIWLATLPSVNYQSLEEEE